jgi:hypothetical protein
MFFSKTKITETVSYAILELEIHGNSFVPNRGKNKYYDSFDSLIFVESIL